MPDRFSDSANRVVASAESEARQFGHAHVGTEHLLLGILDEDGRATQILHDAGVTLAAARTKVAEIGVTGLAGVEPPLSDRARRALDRAGRLSLRQRDDAVEPLHVLVGVLDVEGRAGQVLRSLSVDPARVRDVIDGRAPQTAAPAPSQSAAPRCPKCDASLEATLAIRTVAAAGGDRGSTPVAVVYCAACGSSLGVAPA